MENIDTKITVLETKVESHEKRISDHGRQIDQLQIDSAKQDTMLRQILDATSETKATVKALAEKPVKRWDSFVMSIITAVGAGLAGAFLLWLGLKP